MPSARDPAVFNGVFLQIGSRGFTTTQRDALDTIGRYYEAGIFTLSQADQFGRMVKAGRVNDALAQARVVVDHITRSVSRMAA